MNNGSRLAITMLLVTFATGCAAHAVRPDQQTESQGAVTAAASGEMGPPLPPSGVQGAQQAGNTGELVGPAIPPEYVPPKDGYVVVLGPGLARTLAYVGALHEMEDRGVQVRAIVAVEMGAMIGGVWAGSNLNNLEWELHKFKRSTLLDLPLLALGSKVAEGKKLYSFLDDALKVSFLQKMRVPVLVASTVRNSEGIIAESNGSGKDIIRGAMSIPGIIKPYVFEGKERQTAALESPFPVKEAKELALGKVLCLDVLGRGDNFSPKEQVEEQLSNLMRSAAAIARQQLRECDAVLSIPTDGISYLNFDAKAELSYRGKLAVRKWLEQPK